MRHLYDASKNQEMGIVPTSACVGNGKEEYECKVVLDDDAEVAYSVISVDKNGIYTLQKLRRGDADKRSTVSYRKFFMAGSCATVCSLSLLLV